MEDQTSLERKSSTGRLSGAKTETSHALGWGGIRTRGTLRYTRFPGVPNRPLWHPSKRASRHDAAEYSDVQTDSKESGESGGSGFSGGR